MSSFPEWTSLGEPWFLVAYLEGGRGSVLPSLREALESRRQPWTVRGGPGPLPFELGPYSAAEARKLQRLLDEAPGCAGRRSEECLLWQPPADELPELGASEALTLALDRERDESPSGAVARWTQVQGCSLARCWAFLLQRGPHSASSAWLVDRCTRQVLRRLAGDVEHALWQQGLLTRRAC